MEGITLCQYSYYKIRKLHAHPIRCHALTSSDKA
jgi:hypothetical protein